MLTYGTSSQALTALLPPSKQEMDPLPEIVDEVPFEQSDLGDVRDPPLSAGAHFFDHSFASFAGSDMQFGGLDDEDEGGDWVDEDEEDEEGMEAPECAHQ